MLFNPVHIYLTHKPFAYRYRNRHNPCACNDFHRFSTPKKGEKKVIPPHLTWGILVSGLYFVRLNNGSLITAYGIGEGASPANDGHPPVERIRLKTGTNGY
jgi:hypothetical protein